MSIIIYFSLHIHEEYNKNTYADMYNIKTDIAPKVRECDTVTIFDIGNNETYRYINCNIQQEKQQ